MTRSKLPEALFLSLLVASSAATCLADRPAEQSDVRGRLDPAQITAVDQSNRKQDLELTARIRQELVNNSSLSRYAQNLTIVTTTDDRVVIRGTVNTAAERDLVRTVAAKVAGNRPIQLDVNVVQPSNK